MSQRKKAASLAIDVTTTELALAVRDERGQEDFASMPMQGAMNWKEGFPGFDLAPLPGMLRELLGKLIDKEGGWDFDRSGEATPGYVSVACRQHDLVLLDKGGQPAMPAISWQCNAAKAEVQQLKRSGVEKQVGKVEPRFVLPKLMCILKKDKSLRRQIATAFMTGDWIAWKLTGKLSLSTSDALSNGLLDQKTRKRADGAIKKAGLNVAWFPKVVPSGKAVGKVLAPKGEDGPWRQIQAILAGWQFVAGLGDNHASAVGCGMKADYKTLVVSAGTSGTINFTCPKTTQMPADGRAVQFEFYSKDILLLLMLADCGAWYNRFLAEFAADYRERLNDLNGLALEADLGTLHRVLHDDGEHVEQFPPDWGDWSVGRKAAATQLSIALELLRRAGVMLDELRQAGRAIPETFVLTGGLSQSLFFQQVFYSGVKLLAPAAAVKVSGRTGPLRYKTSASGALVNAELPQAGSLAAIHQQPDRFPLVDCAAPASPRAEQLQYLLKTYFAG